MTALESYRTLLKDHIGPRLRDLGWQGSGPAWKRPHPTHWVLLGFQKSSASDAEAVPFTANLKVIGKDAWDAENVPPGRVPQRPSTSVSWGVGWERRLGGLIPAGGGDRWWVVQPGDDLAALADEVLGALTHYGFPGIDEELAAAAAQPRTCRHNVGGHNWFEPCGRTADMQVRLGDRVLDRCHEHGTSLT